MNHNEIQILSSTQFDLIRPVFLQNAMEIQILPDLAAGRHAAWGHHRAKLQAPERHQVPSINHRAPLPVVSGGFRWFCKKIMKTVTGDVWRLTRSAASRASGARTRTRTIPLSATMVRLG